MGNYFHGEDDPVTFTFVKIQVYVEESTGNVRREVYIQYQSSVNLSGLEIHRWMEQLEL